MEELEGDEVTVCYEDVDALVGDFRRLLEGAGGDPLSDVLLEDEDGTPLEAHALLLRSRSEYLEVALGPHWGGWRPAQRIPGRLAKPGSSRSALMSVVGFIYTGEVSFNEKDVYAVVDLAREMMLDDLVKLGHDFVASRLAVTNAAYHAGKSLESADEVFQLHVANFLEKQGKQVLRSSEFMNCTRNELEAVLSHEKLGVDEDAVLKAAQIWSEVTSGFDRDQAFMFLTEILNDKMIRVLSLSSKAYRSLEDLGLIPDALSHLRRMYKGVLADNRYLVESNTFRPALRNAVQVTESEHPLLKTVFSTKIELMEDADAILIEDFDLVFMSTKSEEEYERLSHFKYIRSRKCFVVSGHRVKVVLEYNPPLDGLANKSNFRRRSEKTVNWGFRIEYRAVITGKRWRRHRAEKALESKRKRELANENSNADPQQKSQTQGIDLIKEQIPSSQLPQ